MVKKKIIFPLVQGSKVIAACQAFDKDRLARFDAVMTEALELLTGRRQLFLQEPSVFYYPGLPQMRFYDPADFPWLEQMLALLPEMQAELHSILSEGANGFAPYVHRPQNRPAPNNPLLDNDAWTAFHFWRDGDVVAENALRCPAIFPLPRRQRSRLLKLKKSGILQGHMRGRHRVGRRIWSSIRPHVCRHRGCPSSRT